LFLVEIAAKSDHLLTLLTFSLITSTLKQL